MTDDHAATRKFERFLSGISGNYYNNNIEVREDTKGALYDEIQRSEERIYKEPQIIEENNGKEEILGVIKFDFDKDLIKEFTPKSRGKLRDRI